MIPVVNKTNIKDIERIRFDSMLSSLISKFTDGERRFNESSLVHNMILSLANGADPIALLDQCIIMHENLQKSFEDHIKSSPIQNIFK
jgi:hypothetical protein